MATRRAVAAAQIPYELFCRMKSALILFLVTCSAALAADRLAQTSPVKSRGSSTSLHSAQNDRAGEARTAEEERAGFSLAEGFVAQLVADESVMKKAVAFNFDDAGRMWVTTASEYPLDGNEQPEKAAALYRDGGKDNVLIFDTPWGEGLQKPRIWAGVAGDLGISGFPDSRKGTGANAQRLAMPMGVLPYKDGAIIQHGSELLFLRDTDGDGRADTRQVLLAGFGIQDSHLMPHGFTRGPGDWIYFAQGAFNTSVVKTKEGPTVEAKYCKMMRMKPDGSRFEICCWGLNNIWGFVIDSRGEMWIQEANDLGYPIAPFQIGMCYPGIGNDKAKPYAPFMPPPAKLNDCAMGGTGLSGLALNEDAVTWPAPWTEAFMVANPITNKIQAIRVHRDAPGYDGVKLEKLPDFLTSADPQFRPVAIQFGPDGALYVIDWYNKIISHNEVPRTHPERDKIRTRIWRIRATSAPKREVPNLAKATSDELVAHLGANNQWEANAARFELRDRGANMIARSLATELTPGARSIAEELQRFWTLEGTDWLEDSESRRLWLDRDVTKEHPAFRRELIRAAGNSVLAERLLTSGNDQSQLEHDPQVLSELVRSATRARITLWRLLTMVPPPGDASTTNDKVLPARDADFLRYLIRSILESRPVEVREALASIDADSVEGRRLRGEPALLAALSLPPEEGAIRLLSLWPAANRPLVSEELALLASQIGQPSVRVAFTEVLSNPAMQRAALESLGRLDAQKVKNLQSERDSTSARSTKSGGKSQPLPELIARAARELIAREPNGANNALLVRLARNFRIPSLESEVVNYIDSAGTKPAEQIEALKALRELGSDNVLLFSKFATAKNEELRREAVTALASAKSERVVPMLIELWPQLPVGLRKIALDRVASTKSQAEAIARAARSGLIPPDDLDTATLDKLAAVLGNGQTDLAALLKEMKGATRPVLRLTGKPGDIAQTKIDLSGAFTVEAWIRLDPGIDNNDNLLGRKGGADFNFYDSKLRVFGGPAVQDVVIAKTAIKPDTWTHVAVTRDDSGTLRIYLNGELDAQSAQPFADALTGLNIGETNPGKGADARYAEFRVWDVARSAEEIRDHYLMSFVPARAATDHPTSNPTRPAHLVRYMNGADGWGTLQGAAHVEQTRDFPELLTAAEANALAGKFANFRVLAAKDDDAALGRNLFTGICMACHMVNGQGGNIGPNLSGAGAMGTEALLRNILTPNAQLESGYYRHDVELMNGDVLSGFLVAQNDREIILRQIGSDDRTVPRSELKKLIVSKKSLMPEGLLEGLSPQQVSDLFTYLRTLK